jgi:hypothetical protein
MKLTEKLSSPTHQRRAGEISLLHLSLLSALRFLASRRRQAVIALAVRCTFLHGSRRRRRKTSRSALIKSAFGVACGKVLCARCTRNHLRYANWMLSERRDMQFRKRKHAKGENAAAVERNCISEAKRCSSAQRGFPVSPRKAKVSFN